MLACPAFLYSVHFSGAFPGAPKVLPLVWHFGRNYDGEGSVWTIGPEGGARKPRAGEVIPLCGVVAGKP